MRMKNPEGISSSIFKQEPTDDNSSLQPPSSISSVNQSCHNRLIDNNNNNIYLNDQHFNLTAYPYSNAVTIDTINKTNSILSITDEKLIPTSQTMITNNNNLITKKFQNPFINFNLTNQFSYPLSSLPLSPSSSSHQTSDSIQYVNTSLQDVNYSTSAASVLIPSSIFDASQLPTTIAASTSTMNSNLNTNTTSSLHNQRASISRNSLKSSLLNSVTRTSQSSVSSSPLTCYHTSKTSSTLTTSTHNRLLGNQQCGISSRSNVQNDHSRPFNPPPPPSQPQNQSAPTSSSHHHPHHHRHHHHHLHHYRNTSICSRASYMCRKCKTHGHNIPVKRHKRTCPYTNCTCIKCHLVDQGRKVVARQIALYRDQKGNSHRDIHDQLDGNRVQPTNNGSWRSSSISSLSSTTTTISTTTTTTTTSANINLEINKTDEIKINKNLNNNRSNNSNNHLSNHSGIHTTINDSNTKTNSVLLPLSHSSSLRSVVALIDEKQTITSGPHCRRCRNHSIAVTWKGHKKTCPFRNCPCDPCRLINVRKDTEKTLREMVSHSEMKPFTGSFKENRNSFPTYTPRLATQTNSVVSEPNNHRFDYLPKSIHSNYTNGNQPVEQHFIPCTQESVPLRPPNSSTCLTQLLHNNNNVNNVPINPSHCQFNQKTNSRPNSIDSIHSQNSSDIHSNSNNNNNSITLPNSSNLCNVNHLKGHLKSTSQLKASNLSPYRELTHLSSTDWWIQPTNLLTTSTQSLSSSSITFLPTNLTLPVNTLQNQNHLSDDCMQVDRISLENMNHKINNSNNTDSNTVEYGSTIMTTAMATSTTPTTRAGTGATTTTDVSQLGSVEDYYEQSIMKNDLVTGNNSDFICNDINNSNNNKNYYYDNIDYISCIGDYRNLPTYTPKINRCQGNNPMGMMMMMTNQNTSSNTIPAATSTTTLNGNNSNNNNNRFASCFNSQLPSETAFYCPERVSAVAAAAAAAAAMVAMTPGISNSPRHCSHHHYHHHHCYAHTHCHINQNCRGDVPPPQPPPAPPQRHEEDNLDGEDDGEGMEEDYDDDEDEDIDDGNELGDEDPKRYYHHYHHLIGQPVSPQHHHHQQQQNHKSYDITDAPGSYTNLEQNKTVRGYFPFDNIHTGQDESRLPLGNKTGIIGGDTLAYIDDYHDPSIEYYSRLNRSPKDWKTNRGETDHIRSSQQSQLSTLVQYTGNNSKKYDIRLTGTLPSVSSSAMSAVSSVPFSHLTVENFRDSNLTTISLSTSSDCMPDSVQTNLTNSLSFLPTNISLDYLNPIWRNQSAHKMNQSLSDIPIQIDNSDNDNNNNNGDDRDSTSKQIHSRLLINQIQNSKFEFSKQITTQSDNGVITVVNVGDGDGDEEEDDDGDGDGDENRSIWSLNAIQQQGECNNNTEIIPINQSNFLTMNSMNFESASGVRDSSLLMTG